jgi:hypothetical protein
MPRTCRRAVCRRSLVEITSDFIQSLQSRSHAQPRRCISDDQNIGYAVHIRYNKQQIYPTSVLRMAFVLDFWDFWVVGIGQQLVGVAIRWHALL